MSEVRITVPGRTPEVIADEIRNLDKQAAQVCAQYIFEIGRRLVEVKGMVEPGEWLDYIRTQLHYERSTAENYMRIYRKLCNPQISLYAPDSQALEGLSYSQLIELTYVPDEELAEFLEENDVENMSTRELKKAIRERDKEKQQRETAEAALRDVEQNLLDAQNQLSTAKSSEGAWQQEIDKLTAAVHLAETGEKNANNKVMVLENQLKDAQEKVRQANADLKKAKEHPEIPENVLEELRAQAEAEAAEKSEAELQKKLASAAAALDKEAQKRQEAEHQLEEAKKRQIAANPNLVAVQIMGTKIVEFANSINDHRMKAVMQDEANAKPINAYLIDLVNELRQSFGIKLEDLKA